MPRPKIAARERRTEVEFVKLRRDESKALRALSKQRRKDKKTNWSKSAIMREGLLLLLQREAA